MLTVIGNAYSRTFRVVWMLEELGMLYKYIPAKPHSPEVLKYNPAGKVPVMLDDKAVLVDSTAIIQYIADQAGYYTYPAGTLQRARQDGWTGMLLDEIDSCIWTAAKHSFVLPPERRIRDIKSTLHWEFNKSMARISAHLEDNKYLMGSKLTVPDFILVHCLIWAERANFKWDYPELDRYLRHIQYLPSFIRAIEK